MKHTMGVAVLQKIFVRWKMMMTNPHYCYSILFSENIPVREKKLIISKILCISQKLESSLALWWYMCMLLTFCPLVPRWLWRREMCRRSFPQPAFSSWQRSRRPAASSSKGSWTPPTAWASEPSPTRTPAVSCSVSQTSSPNTTFRR